MKELDSTAKDNTMVTSEHKRSLASLVKAAAAIMKETDAIKLDVKKYVGIILSVNAGSVRPPAVDFIAACALDANTML